MPGHPGGERPNPNLSVEPGYNSTTPAGQMTPWILTLVPRLHDRDCRQARSPDRPGPPSLGGGAPGRRAAAWQVRSRVRKALLDLHGATGTAALLQRQQDLQEANVALIERQLAAGAISPFELTQARLALDAIRLGFTTPAASRPSRACSWRGRSA